jgi:hypothetical protein
LISILANVAIAVFKVKKVWWAELWDLYVGLIIGGKLDLMVLIGGAEEQAAIQGERSCVEFCG